MPGKYNFTIKNNIKNYTKYIYIYYIRNFFCIIKLYFSKGKVFIYLYFSIIGLFIDFNFNNFTIHR